MVGVVYLAGEGVMHFMDEVTGEETSVDVRPGRFISWSNERYTHSVVRSTEASSVPRHMLGKYINHIDGGG